MEHPQDWAGRRKRLVRRETQMGRYLTCSCHRRLQLFAHPRLRDVFAEELSRARQTCGSRLHAWVLMPEHFHVILMSQDDAWPVPRILRRLKQPIAEFAIARWRELSAPILDRLRVSDGRVRFWQAGGGFDRNIRTADEFHREVAYVHQNPVKRGLVQLPTDWAWSSARWYAGLRVGQVEMDVE